MSSLPLRVPHHFTGIGTSAADVAKLLEPTIAPSTPTGHDIDAAGTIDAIRIFTTPRAINPVATNPIRNSREDMAAPLQCQVTLPIRQRVTGPNYRGVVPTGDHRPASGEEPPVFDMPWRARSSPDVARARRANVARMKTHGMLDTREAKDWYLSWDMGQLSGYSYPLAVGDDLDLAVDKEAFFFVFDDQFDGPLGRSPARAAAFTDELIAVLYRPPGAPCPAGSSPLVTFFASMWDRSHDGMPRWWINRAARDWEYYLSTHAAEAIDRVAGRVPNWEHFLHVRRGMAGSSCMVDYGQRLGHFAVPLCVFHTPQHRQIRQTGIDVPMLCNDVHSVYKEAPRGDVDNAVLVVEHERGCDRAEAMRIVRDLVMDTYIPRFQRLEQELPDICDILKVDDTGREAVNKSVAAIKAWITGYHQWEIETGRYTVQGTIPADRPNYVEDLVTPFGF
ncbi:terpene synthase family protein [Nocardia terpenica]|uniref:Terpene cyclase n=1 Tax=Nocardia terpenica TaxID=455432 RepID=A0A6G9Z7N1_9NOCA|nr:terpene synthase family protein [Nocardia terpenica]QIS21502.1 terpene cyclase [Nocardia terpenica]